MLYLSLVRNNFPTDLGAVPVNFRLNGLNRKDSIRSHLRNHGKNISFSIFTNLLK